jgi:hypothetical protein
LTKSGIYHPSNRGDKDENRAKDGKKDEFLHHGDDITTKLEYFVIDA